MMNPFREHRMPHEHKDYGSGRPDEWDTASTNIVDLKVKEYKCTRCKKRCAGTFEGLKGLVDVCPDSKNYGRMECGLKQMKNFVERMEEKGKDVKTPALLIPDFSKSKYVAPVETSDKEYEANYPDPIRIMVSKKGDVDEIAG